MADLETLAAETRVSAEVAAPSTPSAGTVVTYAKTDGLMYSKDDGGTETLMSSGASLSNPMTTAHDIIRGNVAGPGAPERVALGASNTVLASSNSTLAYASLGTRAFAPDSLNAVAAPGASNDFTQGWRRGSLWVDTSADKAYVCLDETTGAAVWTEITQSGGGGGGLTHTYNGASSAGADAMTPTADTIYFRKITLASAGFLASIEGYMENKSGSAQGIPQVGVWADDSSQPGAILAIGSPARTSVNAIWLANSVPNWVSLPVNRYLAAGDYWLGIVWYDDVTDTRLYRDTTGGTGWTLAVGGDWLRNASGAGSSSVNDFSLRASILT